MTEVGKLPDNAERSPPTDRRRMLTALATPVLLLAATRAADAATGPSAGTGHHPSKNPAKPASANDRFVVAGTTDADVRPFLANLQSAVASDDRRTVLRMFFFPSKVWDGNQSFTVVRRRDLAEHYDAVFDASLKQAVAQAKVDTLLANWQGVALGNGRLWFARITTQNRLAITSINPPDKANG